MAKNYLNAKPIATKQDFPIVGIGASAGGLHAFKKFLQALPEHSGMAYVFVQHLLPSHESRLPEILARFTPVPVFEITDDIHLVPDTIYVIPENKILTSFDGRLRLEPREKRTNNAIDVFFTSLAKVHRSLAVGVVLSGIGSDGALGLKAIKKYGGITFVQDPDSADYPSMPQAAIAARVADFIVPLEEIQKKIIDVMENRPAIIPVNNSIKVRGIALSEGRQRDPKVLAMELESLIGELRASKEELRWGNNELNLINAELRDKQEQSVIAKNYTDAVIATLREPFVILDSNLYIRNINGAFEKQYEILQQEASGKHIYEILDNVFDNGLMRTMLEKVLPEKLHLDDYQITVHLKSSGTRALLLNARQITNEQGKEQLILLAIEDITDRRLAEGHLKMLSQGFEENVRKRTLELEATVKELHKANIKLQQFAYITSHDLQEPLRKILTFVSILKDRYENLPAGAADLVYKIGTSSSRLKMLVNDLLAYSYLNNENVLFVPTDLNTIIKNILGDFELLIEQQQVKISVGILPTINAIPLQMNQLFYNLISNAIKFSDSGNPPTIDISSRTLSSVQVAPYKDLDKKLSWCEIIVKDNGIGFEQHYEKQIFKIFQRLHTNDMYSGTGIGLAISKKIMENHRGIIFAKSSPNQGAQFHIIIPFTRVTDTKGKNALAGRVGQSLNTLLL